MTTDLAAAPVRRRRRTRAQMLEHVRSLHLQWLCREFIAVRDAAHDAAHDAVRDAGRR